MITLACPWPDPPLRSNKRLHHMAEHRIKRDIRQAGYAAGMRVIYMESVRSHALFPMGEPVHVCMIWTVPTKHRRDADSAQPSLKSYLDGLVDAGVLRDDSWQHVPRAWCEIEHRPGEPMSVRVEITPAKEPT